jgi:hypothetical protein
MMSVIKDGTGTGNAAKVNNDNKLETVTISTDIQQDASINKRLYRISTPVLTLTTANDSTLLYVKNDDPNNNLIVPNIVIAVGNSTGNSSGDLVTSIGRANVTGGTIVSDATAASLIPLNLSVTTAPAITTYSGAEGKTSTYTADIPSYAAFPQESITFNPFFITVAPGNNFIISITPPAGNTSMTAQVTARCYLQPIES